MSERFELESLQVFTNDNIVMNVSLSAHTPTHKQWRKWGIEKKFVSWLRVSAMIWFDHSYVVTYISVCECHDSGLQLTNHGSMSKSKANVSSLSRNSNSLNELLDKYSFMGSTEIDGKIFWAFRFFSERYSGGSRVRAPRIGKNCTSNTHCYFVAFDKNSNVIVALPLIGVKRCRHHLPICLNFMLWRQLDCRVFAVRGIFLWNTSNLVLFYKYLVQISRNLMDLCTSWSLPFLLSIRGTFWHQPILQNASQMHSICHTGNYSFRHFPSSITLHQHQHENDPRHFQSNKSRFG